MEKKLVLEELYRMRELMGLKVLSETKNIITHNLLMEGGKTVDELIGLGPKSVDNLTKNGVDFVNDLTKLSDEFAARGIKTFADLTDEVALSKGVNVADVTDDMIESYIKSDEKLYQSILAKASAAAADQIDQLVKSANLTTIFSKDPQQLISYKTYISTPPSARNVDLLINSVDDSIDEVEGLIDDIQTGKIPGVDTVPDELQDLYENLLAKKTDLENFKNRGNSTSFEEDPYIPPIFDDGVEDIVEDLSTPIEKLLDSIKNRDSIKKRLGGISDDAISDIEANLKGRYGTLTPEQMIKYMGQAESDFLTLIKREEDELNELIKKGNEEDILKKQKYIEGLKKAWKLMYDNIFTRGCVGKSTSAVKGQIKSNIEFQGGKSVAKSVGCLIAGYLAYDIIQWLNTPKKDREFIACPVLTFLGSCETYANWGLCQKSCGESTSTSVTNTKFKNEQEELDVLLVNIKRQVPTLSADFKVTKVLTRDADGNATSVSWSDPNATPSTGTMVWDGSAWQ
jgi:hypothetical protein